MDFLSTIFWLIEMSLLFLFVILSILVIKIFTGKSISDPSYAPMKGTVYNHLFHFDHLYHYQTQVAKTLPTFRLLSLSHSQIFTTDARNIEHILKTNFDKYAKSKYFEEIVSDLWGQGIFAVDGDKWRQQRKLASYEFSTRVLRDFSCSVFRKNAAKLVTAVSELAMSNQVIEFQDMFMKCATESISKVGFGIDLNCMDWSSDKEGTAFMKALDDANESLNLRFMDPFWKLKRFLNIGSEASLKNNIKVINNFIYNIMNTKKKLLAINPDNIKEDILSRFLAESKKNPKAITDQYLRDIILNFLLAGKDSTAITLCWFFYMLCKNPLIQEKVAQEVIDNITGGEENDANFEDFIATITDATLEKMHYLHAALT
ncbi:hypothetical protein DITRI_Ditri13aG0026400 [Diplodiscus trichospermus]